MLLKTVDDPIDEKGEHQNKFSTTNLKASVESPLADVAAVRRSIATHCSVLAGIVRY